MRVLIADDSGTMRTIIRRTLESMGVSGAVEVADGQQAMELYKSAAGNFHLVLTDWNLPTKSGVEVVREIRLLDKSVPILMVTTETDKTRVLEAIAAGVSDYLVKPFTTDALRKKLERYTP